MRVPVMGSMVASRGSQVVDNVSWRVRECADVWDSLWVLVGISLGLVEAWGGSMLGGEGGVMVTMLCEAWGGVTIALSLLRSACQVVVR